MHTEREVGSCVLLWVLREAGSCVVLLCVLKCIPMLNHTCPCYCWVWSESTHFQKQNEIVKNECQSGRRVMVDL